MSIGLKINTAFEVSGQVLFAGLGVILFKGIAYQISHVASHIAVDQPHKWRRHDQNEPLVAIGDTALLQFPCQLAGKVLSFMLFGISGGNICTAAVAKAPVVSGAVGNQILAFFSAGIVSELL